MVVTNDAEERVYLQEYFGQSDKSILDSPILPDAAGRHIFYAMAFLLVDSSGKPVDRTENAPEFGDFGRRIWAGEVKLRDNDVKIVYGRVHLEQLLHNVRQARFDEALRIVSDRHACPIDIVAGI